MSSRGWVPGRGTGWRQKSKGVGARQGDRVETEIQGQSDSMLPCVCLVKDHRRPQNISDTCGPLFCSYHILMSSVI